MRSPQPRLPILSGFLVSVLIHAAVLIPMLVMAMTPASLGRMAARFDPEDFAPKDKEKLPPLPEPDLGIDRDTPSSLTWVGYEEYQEHLARLAEIEQAAFTTSPPAGGAPQEPVTAQVTGGAQSPQETAPQPAETSEQAGSPLNEEDLIAIRKFMDSAQVTSEKDDPADAEGAKAETATPTPQAEETVKRPQQEVPREGEAAPPAPSSVPAAKPAPAEAKTDGEDPEAEERPGEARKKESDATSVIDVPLDKLKLGKPIARPGLELKPRRPKFTTLMKVSASPCNPIVQICFDRNGKPVAKDTKILKTSCDRRVDHAIENSLFRLARFGKQLEKLGDGETKTVQLKIILNPRAK